MAVAQITQPSPNLNPVVGTGAGPNPPSTGSTSYYDCSKSSINPLQIAYCAGQAVSKQASGVTNLFAGFTWGRVGAFILGVFLVGLGVWGLLGSGSKQTIVELGKGAAAG